MIPTEGNPQKIGLSMDFSKIDDEAERETLRRRGIPKK